MTAFVQTCILVRSMCASRAAPELGLLRLCFFCRSIGTHVIKVSLGVSESPRVSGLGLGTSEVLRNILALRALDLATLNILDIFLI